MKYYWQEEFESIGGKITKGKVWLYHATTREKAESILREGVLRDPEGAPDSYGAYLSSSESVANDYGDGTLVRVLVKASDLVPDDVFPGRRMDFLIKTRNGIYRPLDIKMGKNKKSSIDFTPDELNQEKDRLAQEAWEQAKRELGIDYLNSEEEEEVLHKRFSQIYRKMLSQLRRKNHPVVRKDYKDISRWLDIRVLEEVEDSYDSWVRSGKNYREPSLSIGVVLEMVESRKRNVDFYYLIDKVKYSLVQQSLNRLVRQGKLESSLGFGYGRGDRETRLYNPVMG